MNYYTVDNTTAAFTVMATSTAKAHLSLPSTSTVDDDQLTAAIGAAESFVAARAGGRYGIQRTIDVVYERFPYGDGRLCLPLGPLQGTPTVTYYDASNSSTTVASTDFVVHRPRQKMPFIKPAPNRTWPGTEWRPDAVTVTAIVGHSTGSTTAATEQAKVPKAYLAACKLALGDLWENRGDIDPGVNSRTQDRIDALVATEGAPVYA